MFNATPLAFVLRAMAGVDCDDRQNSESQGDFAARSNIDIDVATSCWRLSRH